MYKVVRKQDLNPTVSLMEVEAPMVARRAKAGQFIIVIPDENGERIPLTIADYDRQRGTVTIIFQVVGTSTLKLKKMRAGDSVYAFVGPLGRPTHIEGLKSVAVIGGGVGAAIAYPVAKALHEAGTRVTTIVGFRSRDLVILEEEFAAVSDTFVKTSDDGSWGVKGLVTDALRSLVENGAQFDEVIAIGPVVMMKFVSLLTKELGIKTVVSMNPVMIDGTGMCGGCRLTVGGETKFACVDGPEFDGHLVDFDEAMSRSSMYRDAERHSYEETCKLFSEVQ